MIRVAIIDGDPTSTRDLVAALGRFADLRVAWTASDLESARAAFRRPEEVEVALIGVRLSDGSGLDLLSGPSGQSPRFLVLSSWDRPIYATVAARRGAVGCLLRTAPIDEIAAAVRDAMSARVADKGG